MESMRAQQCIACEAIVPEKPDAQYSVKHIAQQYSRVCCFLKASYQRSKAGICLGNSLHNMKDITQIKLSMRPAAEYLSG